MYKCLKTVFFFKEIRCVKFILDVAPVPYADFPAIWTLFYRKHAEFSILDDQSLVKGLKGSVVNGIFCFLLGLLKIHLKSLKEDKKLFNLDLRLIEKFKYLSERSYLKKRRKNKTSAFFCSDLNWIKRYCCQLSIMKIPVYH